MGNIVTNYYKVHVIPLEHVRKMRTTFKNAKLIIICLTKLMILIDLFV